MTVYKKMKNGKEGKYWYYNFTLYGKRYNKSTLKTNKQEAMLVEEKVKQEIVSRHQLMVTDGAKDIDIDTAVELAIEKPCHKPRGEKQDQRKRQIWNDFTAWLKELYPDVELLHHITRPMADAYIMQLRDHGKFLKVIKQPGKKAFYANKQLASKTVNAYHKEVQWVFEQLIADAGLTRNPFTHIKKLIGTQVKREIFLDDELRLIENSLVNYPFCKHLYYIGTGTGMRMGNICLLRWEDISMDKRIIQCENLKTGGKLTIPILDEVYHYLSELGPRTSGYVSEEHAEAYKNCDTNVSLTFRRFLNEIGIETTVKVEGRSRSANIKGIHAMRHTFIYRAMIANIPINIIQCIVGHVDEDVTKMYADHVMASDAQKAMKGFSISKQQVATDSSASSGNQLLTELAGQLAELPPERQKQLLDLFQLTIAGASTSL